MATPERLNTVLLLPYMLEKRMCKLSLEIAERFGRVFFILNNVAPRAHITLYEATYNVSVLREVLQQVRAIADQTPIVRCHGAEWACHHGYVGVALKPAAELMLLHQRVVVALNPYRDTTVESRPEWPLSKVEEQNVRDFGQPHVMSEYAPHITLTRLKTEQEQPAADREIDINHGVMNFQCRTMAVVRSWEHGTCASILEEFDLQPPPKSIPGHL